MLIGHLYIFLGKMSLQPFKMFLRTEQSSILCCMMNLSFYWPTLCSEERSEELSHAQGGAKLELRKGRFDFLFVCNFLCYLFVLFCFETESHPVTQAGVQ